MSQLRVFFQRVPQFLSLAILLLARVLFPFYFRYATDTMENWFSIISIAFFVSSPVVTYNTGSFLIWLSTYKELKSLSLLFFLSLILQKYLSFPAGLGILTIESISEFFLMTCNSIISISFCKKNFFILDSSSLSGASFS